MPEPALPEPTAGPALQEIVGALILGADHPISVAEIRRVIEAVEAERRAEQGDGPPVTDEELLATDRARGETPPAGDVAPPAVPTPEDESLAGATGIDGRAIKAAVAELQSRLVAAGTGFDIVEVAGGYRLRTLPGCGLWVRRMLNRGKPQRISRPMIETLAIVAYRQPIARSEIESIRGVSVGHVIKALMEMQLVRIVGRSDLPGRPFLFGTTTTFLDHFGLKSLNELNAVQPGVSRTPPAEQRAKHVRRRPAAPAATTPAAAEKDPAQPELHLQTLPAAEPPLVLTARTPTPENDPCD